MSTVLYFAYGSNLLPEQMLERCPGSRLRFAATLAGYHLAFRGESSRWGRGGTATLVPRANGRAPGMVYALEPSDVTALNGFESHPSVYRDIAVTVQDREGREHPVYTYLKNGEGQINPPSMKYFHQIWHSYKRFGLDESHLMAAVQETLALPEAAWTLLEPAPAN
ncbi:MAG: gamma-glutamylcyclotransferase [Deltaproteobacteria bacterium]|nr:gamma-glutamylcyclotransferase [Deltaproteobacteria bacterium]